MMPLSVDIFSPEPKIFSHKVSKSERTSESIIAELEQHLDLLQNGEKEFAERALKCLLGISELVRLNESELSAPHDVLQAALGRWLNDPAHGVKHSYAVFQRMLEISGAEASAGRSKTFDHRELEIRAILQDLGEFLPLLNQDNQVIPDTGRQFQRHDLIIAALVRKIGKALGASDTQQLAKDLKEHDYYWSRPTPDATEEMKNHLSFAGQTLADADRLVGENIAESLQRNRANSLGKWYFLRDLTAANRERWMVRSGGIFDGMSAILTEFCGQDHWFYTETGKEMNHKKQELFRPELMSYYTEQYQAGWALLRQAKENNWTVEIGIKGEKNGNKNAIVAQPQRTYLDLNVSSDELHAQLDLLVQQAVPNRSNPQFPGKEYFGYSILINSKEWVDPSVLRFSSLEELAQALEAAVDAYQDYFSPPAATHRSLPNLL